MVCYHPLSAFQQESDGESKGRVVFHETGKIARALELPCGRCRGCRLVRSRSWAIRSVHEAQMHPVNSFVTLTFNDDHYKCSLDYRDFQLFLKRLRKVRESVRFYACGEYGEQTGRAHFHALLFGVGFDADGKLGENLYRSKELERLWPFGNSSYGSVTFQSAGYVAKYAMKKKNGAMAEEYYTRVDRKTGALVRVEPEMGHMSLKNGGIGYSWFVKYWRDVYAARDGVIVAGKKLPPPRFYDRLLASNDPGLSTDKEYDRYINSEKFKEDCTPERLLVREKVHLAKDDFYEKRTI